MGYVPLATLINHIEKSGKRFRGPGKKQLLEKEAEQRKNTFLQAGLHMSGNTQSAQEEPSSDLRYPIYAGNYFVLYPLFFYFPNFLNLIYTVC